MKIGGFCIDRRVLIGLAVLALGVFLLDPGLLRSVLPLMLIAICPLSMLFMMRSMGGHQSSQEPAAKGSGTGNDQADVSSLRRELAELSARQAWISAQINDIAEAQASSLPLAPNGTAADQLADR